MLYQAAKCELQSPPSRIPWKAISIEAGAFVAAALLLMWVL